MSADRLFRSAIVLMTVFTLGRAGEADARDRWAPEQTRTWYDTQPWPVGCNYLPSTAVNQLEMWQADTFDPDTIDRELGWAAGLGFTSARVFLHHLPFEQDRDAFLDRVDRFLGIAARHKIGVMLVLFDSCWDPNPKPGKQPAPQPGVHNSGWVQSPGAADLSDPARHKLLEDYTRVVVGRFKGDKRVQVWDVWNEPDNQNENSYGRNKLKREPADKLKLTVGLLPKVFTWAREAEPTQPLTSGVWIGQWGDDQKLSPTERIQVDESDVISFHQYGRLDATRKCVANLRRYNRPILCTEFMARPHGSTFDPLLGFFREQRVGAYCWGFVAGKSQTQYPWDSWQKPYPQEPKVWFHDVLRADGTAYDPKEVTYIRRITGVEGSGAKSD
jgi:hypothetical protein